MIPRTRSERVVICDETWSPIGDLRSWDNLTMTERLCDVGTGALTAPASDPNRELLSRGRTLLKKCDGVTEMAGMISFGEIADESGTQIRLAWDSPMKYLADRLIYQDPTSPAEDQSAVAYDVRSGQASSVILQFAEWNAGHKALPDRRVFGLRLGDDPGIGQVLTFSGRQNNLLDTMRALALPNGLMFSIRTVDREHIVEVVPVRDLSDYAVFSQGLYNLGRHNWSITPPTGTVVIAGGRGELTDREFQEVTSPESRAQAAAWGRRVEVFYDANNDTGTELRAGALRELADRGETIEAIFEPVDTADLKLGIDYRLGDLVKVILRPAARENGRVVRPPETAIKPIREITTTISRARGRVVVPTAGDYAATSSTGAAFTLRDVQRQVKAFQRNR